MRQDEGIKSFHLVYCYTQYLTSGKGKVAKKTGKGKSTTQSSKMTVLALAAARKRKLNGEDDDEDEEAKPKKIKRKKVTKKVNIYKLSLTFCYESNQCMFLYMT